MSISRHPLPIFSREIRIGLVLYGGISLAIYMNGVCQEFHNAIRGRGIYKLIKALTDSDIVVDIISGTSAGGVNGILLGYAIANSSHDAVVGFNNFANLWIEKGDIKELIQKKSNLKGKPPSTSFLNGEYYQECLEKAFERGLQRSSENDWYSEFKELDLFITATDLDGRVNKVPDNTGAIIEIKDHRTIFHLKYRQDQTDYIENPFKPEKVTQAALAKLCRMTSCFPIAFPVVEVKLYPDDNDPDYKLVNWGKLTDQELDPTKVQEGVLSFVDGGVLSNRPFTSTIQTIYGRTAYRFTERKLFYIDPNPDQFPNPIHSSLSESYSTHLNAIESPARHLRDPLQIAWDSKVEIPNYQSITRDLELIKEGNRKVIRNQLLKQSLESKTGSQLKHLLAAHKQAETNKSDHLEEDNYLKCRILGLLDGVIQEVLVNTGEQSNKHKQFLYEAAEILNKQVLSQSLLIKNEKSSDDNYLGDIYQRISSLDIDFFIRKHCFLLGIIPNIIQKHQDAKNIRSILELRYIAYQLSWQLELLKIIQQSCNKILSNYDFDEILDEGKANQKQIQKLYGFLITFYETLLDPGMIRDEPQVSLQLKITETNQILPDSGIVHDEAQVSLQLGATETSHHEPKDQKKSWLHILENYYELSKVIHFPADIDFDHHLIDWSDLKTLLPEQEASLAKKIFEQIYRMPVCQVLTVKPRKERVWEIAKWKTRITQNLARNNENSRKEDPEDVIGSVLNIINDHSRQLIHSISIDLDDKIKILSCFDDFEVIDKILYPYEYLSDIVTKNTIELVRISPNDANEFGFGANKDLHTKLSGYKLNAFGGFLKKAWRSNDILWGRLDGLDRIVKGLITPKSIQNFLQFYEKYGNGLTKEEYLEILVDESLPGATDDERAAIINYLMCIHPSLDYDNPHAEKEFKVFLDHVIRAGQRQILADDILSEDLKNTKEALQSFKFLRKFRVLRKFEKEEISDLEESINKFREKLNNKKLDDAEITKLDSDFESYQRLKQDKHYAKISKLQVFIESIWLIRDIPCYLMYLRFFVVSIFWAVWKVLVDKQLKSIQLANSLQQTKKHRSEH